MKEWVEKEFEESIAIKKQTLEIARDQIIRMAEIIHNAYCRGGKLLVFGNGGSAADAQHLAGELIGRFKMERKPFPCIALTTDTSILTAVANDFGYEHVFAKQIEGLARSGDVVLALSTSGNSANVIQGLKAARNAGCVCLALGGKQGGAMIPLADVSIVVPSDSAQRIQESHILLVHTLCLLIEHKLKAIQ